jgi:hypothetical protein
VKWERQLGRPRRRWELNIRMDVSAILWKGLEWMYMVQDRDHWQDLENTVMNIQVPWRR